MRSSIAVLPLLLAACALTPGEVLERGERSEAQLKQAPAAAAECIARNAGEIAASFVPRIRPLELDGREVLVHGGQEVGTVAVVQLRPAPAGSAAAVYVSPNTIGGDMRGVLLEGC
jgi:hypothetical protein